MSDVQVSPVRSQDSTRSLTQSTSGMGIMVVQLRPGGWTEFECEWGVSASLEAVEELEGDSPLQSLRLDQNQGSLTAAAGWKSAKEQVWGRNRTNDVFRQSDRVRRFRQLESYQESPSLLYSPAFASYKHQVFSTYSCLS